MEPSTLIAIGAILFLLICSGFFSGSETALTAASRPRIHSKAKEGDARAKVVEDLMDDRERLIGGILLGNNLVNILASSIATSVFINLVGEGGVVYATLIMTALVLIFAEVLPKSYAITYPESFSLAVGRPIQLLIRLLSPIVLLVQRVVRLTLAIFGVRLGERRAFFSAEEEIRGAIEWHAGEGSIRKSHRDMLGSILDLDSVTVEDVMVHRKNMEMIDAGNPTREIINKVVASQYTRIPLWRDDPENIVGVMHAKDLLRAVRSAIESGGDANGLAIINIARSPLFVPETTTLREQLNTFLGEKTHFALVVDEYGDLMGLVTLEDILEEIVGEITDEHDFEVRGVRRDGQGGLLVNGDVSIRDLNRKYDWSLPDDDAATIAGLVIYEAEKIPIVGETFSFFGFDFEIMGRQRNQVTKLKMRRNLSTNEESTAA